MNPTRPVPRLPTSRLPGYYDQHGHYHTNCRNSQLIRRYGGRLVLFRGLPVEAQFALVQYMAVAGEAWQQTPELQSALGRQPRLRRTSEQRALVSWTAALLRSLPYYLTEYGDFEVGYLDAVPLDELIRLCMGDRDIREAYPDGPADWPAYHAWYITTGTCHPGTGDWPVILSSFADETLQDGWHRFHRYVEQGRTSCRAIWFPHRPSPAGLAAYRRVYGEPKRPRKARRT